MTLLRAGVAATAAGGAVLGAAGGASAEGASEGLAAEAMPIVARALSGGTATADSATTSALGPAFGLQLYPMADTSTDPLDNAAGTQIADFRPISTADLTGPLSDGASLSTLPGDTLARLSGAQGHGRG